MDLSSIETAFVVFALLVVTWTPSTVSGACLGAIQCDCEVPPGGGAPIINCRGKQLTTIPSFTPASLFYAELTLANNNIQTVADNSFSGLNIGRLDLTGNQIQTISAKAFYGIETSLKELLMTLSSTADFPTESMVGLDSLLLLEIRGYGKSTLPQDAFLRLSSLTELRLLAGSLTSLTVANVRGQVAHLQKLSLSGNRFTQIPSDALTSLPSLKDLDFSTNQLTRLAARTFARFNSLQSIIFDGNSLENNIDPSAFTDIALTLRSLSFLSCRLGDKSIEAIRPLSQLTVLNFRQNSIANIPVDLFQQMTNIRTLIFDSNRITSVSRSMFQNLSNSLISLDLRDNPLTSIAPNTFSSLMRLEDLELGGITALRLSETSFYHTQALKNLSLERTGVGDTVWKALTPLYNLVNLDLSSAAISNVPDFAFQYNTRLQTIDLSSNSIRSITQSTLAGLDGNLVSLNLNNNQIKTLDHCTFYEFTYFDYSKLGLTGDSLQCDCGLSWLFQKAKLINQTSPFKFSSLQWTCSTGRRFVQMRDEDFQCSGATDAPCLYIRRTSQFLNTITASVSNETTDSVILSWIVDPLAEPSITGFTVSYLAITDSINNPTTIELVSQDRSSLITGLAPSTTYHTCVSMNAGSEWTQNKACVMATTKALPPSQMSSEDLNRSSIIGIAVGSVIGGILIIGGIVLAVICLSRQKKEKEAKKVKELHRQSSMTFASFAGQNQTQSSSQPQVGHGSKRYTRNREPRPYYNPNPTFNPDPPRNRDTKVQSTMSFSQEETDKILALLTAVRSSTSSTDDPRYTTKPYGQGHHNNAYINDEVRKNPYVNDQRKDSIAENHDYDVIPESEYYNEPLDSVV